MYYYAQIKNGKVAAITQASGIIENNPSMVEIADENAVSLGDSYANSVFTTPEPDVITEVRHITKLAFRNRFTFAEKTAIEFASLDDPSADTPTRLQKAALRATLKDQEAATFIDLDQAETVAGVQGLEAMGLLAQGRAEVILSGSVEAGETA